MHAPRKTTRLIVVVAALATITTGCNATSTPTPTATLMVTVQTPATAAAPASPPAGDSSVAASSAAAPTVDAVPAPTPAAAVFTMPDVVGMVLQDAQDRLQAEGSYLMDQRDASGRGRDQVLDSNWKVCTQDPAPGTTVSIGAMVVLASVKRDETCP